jgi:hypothetical protein
VSWDPTVATNLAGENVLPDRDGGIRDGGVLRDSNMIYTDSSVWRMDLSSTTVGSFPAVFNFRKVFSDDGILSNRCFVEVNGLHYVVGVYDVYQTDGFNKQSISDNRWTEWFYQRLGNNENVFVSHYQRPQEIVISYSVDSESTASEAVVYNYFYNTFTRWVFSATGLYTHFTQGPDFGVTIKTWDDLAAEGVLWSDLNSTTWDQLYPQNRNRVPYLLGADTIYRTDVGGQASSVSQIPLLIERIDLDFDEVFNSSQAIKYISQFLPLLTGEGFVRIQFGGRDALSAPVRWQPERTYEIGVDYKFDLRMSRRYPAFRIIQAADEGTLAFDGYDLKIKAVSKR